MKETSPQSPPIVWFCVFRDKVDYWLPRIGRCEEKGGEGGWPLKGMGFLLGVMKCKTDCGAGCQTLNILNSPYYLNTLKGQILHMISILMELLFKIKKKKNPWFNCFKFKVSCDGILEIYSFNNFQIYNSALLTIVTMLHNNTFPGLYFIKYVVLDLKCLFNQLN